MIRLIPLDGSGPFEVPNDALLDRFTYRRDHLILKAEEVADSGNTGAWMPRAHGRPVECRIESWRERAERLERERIAALSAISALAEGLEAKVKQWGEASDYSEDQCNIDEARLFGLRDAISVLNQAP